MYISESFHFQLLQLYSLLFSGSYSKSFQVLSYRVLNPSWGMSELLQAFSSLTCSGLLLIIVIVWIGLSPSRPGLIYKLDELDRFIGN